MGRQQSRRMGEDGEKKKKRMEGFNRGSLKSARKTGVQNFSHQTVKTNKARCCTGTQLNMAHWAKFRQGRGGGLYAHTDEPLALSLSILKERFTETTGGLKRMKKTKSLSPLN